MKTYVLYHGNCPDGFGAAFAAWLKLGEAATYIPVSYGKPMPAMEDKSRVFIVDFSYSRAMLTELGLRMESVVVLDHHETARAELEGLRGCHFDMDKSGAVLAWEHFWPGTKVPLFIRYLEDRDLWRFKLEQSREVSCAVRSYPFDFEVWSSISYLSPGRPRDVVGEAAAVAALRHEGEACLRLTQQQVVNMARGHRWAVMGWDETKVRFIRLHEFHQEAEAHATFLTQSGPEPWRADRVLVLPVANATVFFSEVGERLLQMFPAVPCAAYYSDRADGNRQWGLRSRAGFDCSAVAKAFGGGGHKQAAGFVEKL